MMRHLLAVLPFVAGICCAMSAGQSYAAENARQPNFLFIIADDLGWADVGFHGGKVPTPSLERLRSEGLELTQHYVYPVCSPTRSALLSGRYASRFGVSNPQNERAYRWNTVTLARALKEAGYETALTGKWHLGSKTEWGPQLFGFDHSYGSLAGGVGPWNHRYKTGPFTTTWHRDGTLIEEEGHVTDLIANEAVKWLELRGDKPFFLYVPFTAVHIPIREPEEYVRRAPAEITEPSHREYAACVAHLDDAVGRLLDALERSGKAANTLVVFTSDNGGVMGRNDDPNYPADNYAPGKSDGNNRPLRAQKGTVYEGGVRVPTLVRWPGRIVPGAFTNPVHITDWMPTFCGLAGYRPATDLRWDGRDIWPALSGAEPAGPRAIYINGTGFRSRALRQGDWKLVIHDATREGGVEKTPGKTELFNLAHDPGEVKNVAAEEPAKVAELRELLARISKDDKDALADD